MVERAVSVVDSKTSAPAWTPRERRWALALFALALALRMGVLFDFGAHHPQANAPVIDEAAYDAWARRIAAGDWLGEGVFFQEPLYPYLLGLLYRVFGADLFVARVAQAIVGAATAILILGLGRRTLGRGAGWCAAILWSVYRPALWFPTLLLKENLFAAVFAGLAWCLVSSREQPTRGRWLGVGALAGAGALLRGNLVPMLPFVALWPLARARFFAREAGPAVGCVLVGVAAWLIPVAWRNAAVGGEFALTTSGAGTNLYGGNNLDNRYGVATEFAWVRGVPEHEAGDWRHEAERRTGRELSAVEVSDFWRDATFASIAEHPREHAWILGRKLLLTLGAYEVPDNHFLEWDARHVATLRGPWPGFGLIGPFALLGLGLCLFRRDPRIQRGAAIELALLAGLYLCTIVATVTSDRIRFGLVVLLLPFAGHAARHVGGMLLAWRRASPGELAGTALGLVVSIAVVFAPVLDATERANDFDERDHNLAAGLLRDGGDLEKAGACIADLQARHPRSVRVDLLESDLQFRQARALLEASPAPPDARVRAEALLDEALERLRETRGRSRPQEAFRVHVLAGAIQQYLGRFDAAARFYALALEFDPRDADVLRRRGLCLANEAMALPAGEVRRAGLRSALDLLEPLLEGGGNDADGSLARLVESIRAQL